MSILNTPPPRNIRQVGAGEATVVTVSTVESHLDKLRGAITNIGGRVQVGGEQGRQQVCLPGVALASHACSTSTAAGRRLCLQQDRVQRVLLEPPAQRLTC